MDTKLVYSVAEVADMLDIAVGTAYECVHRGELPSIKLGRRIVIPRKALSELLEQLPAPKPRYEWEPRHD